MTAGGAPLIFYLGKQPDLVKIIYKKLNDLRLNTVLRAHSICRLFYQESQLNLGKNSQSLNLNSFSSFLPHVSMTEIPY
jgi:hypothetical protein